MRTFGGQNINFTILGVKIPPKKTGPNRHFAAKYAKPWSGHISVIDEAIRVKFDRQIENGKKYSKSAKLCQKGSCGGSRDPLLEFLEPPNISRTVEARNFNFGTKMDVGEL